LKPEKPVKLFGTDGIRGEAGKFPLDPTTIRLIGTSLTNRLAESTQGRPPRLVIGRDTRESGSWIERDLIVGALAAGAEVQSAGVITTPGVAFLAREGSAEAGIVISASHNPYQDNGIKVFEPSGRKLDDTMERQIEQDIAQSSSDRLTELEPVGLQDRGGPLRDRYVKYLKTEVARDLSLEGLSLVVDCANGAAYQIAPELFRSLGARVIAINNEPDGRNINLNCGSLHIDTLQRRVESEHADVGVAFDGDADRALFVDHEGNFVDGDATLWVLANYFQAQGELVHDLVVATVMTNLGLEVALRNRGIKLSRTDVGDKYVLDELLRSKAILGGEQSGHIIFPQISLAGDGLITAINLLRVMRQAKKPLSELTQGFSRFPQVLINVRVKRKTPFREIPIVQRVVTEIESGLGNRGRLLLRYSGTEPLARVMIEGEQEGQVNAYATQLASVIEREIGANGAS
jgi:phosphoglucosamine mutase